MKRFLAGGALAVAALAPLAQAAGAGANPAPPRVLFHALGHAPVQDGTPSTVERFQLRNLEYHALHDVTIGFLFDDGQEPVSIDCGPGGVQVDKYTCTYARIPARFLVRLTIRVSLNYVEPHADHFTTIGGWYTAGWSADDTLIVPITPKPVPQPAPPPPAPTTGLLGGITITLGGGLVLGLG